MNAEQLEQWCMGKDVDEVTDLLKNKYNARFVDEKIDDGGDEEGTYVKKRVLSINGGYIDLYYLDTDGIISYAETDNLMEAKTRKKVMKLSESQLRSMIAESIRKVLKENEYNTNEGWFLYTQINNDGTEELRISDCKGDWDYWRKNGGESYGWYSNYEEAARAMTYYSKRGFTPIKGRYIKTPKNNV